MTSRQVKNQVRDNVELGFDKLHRVADLVTFPLAPLDGAIHGTARGVLNWLTDNHPPQEKAKCKRRTHASTPAPPPPPPDPESESEYPSSDEDEAPPNSEKYDSPSPPRSKPSKQYPTRGAPINGSFHNIKGGAMNNNKFGEANVNVGENGAPKKRAPKNRR